MCLPCYPLLQVGSVCRALPMSHHGPQTSSGSPGLPRPNSQRRLAGNPEGRRGRRPARAAVGGAGAVRMRQNDATQLSQRPSQTGLRTHFPQSRPALQEMEEKDVLCLTTGKKSLSDHNHQISLVQPIMYHSIDLMKLVLFKNTTL